MQEIRVTPCPICNEGAAEELLLRSGDIETITCPACGQYKISDATVTALAGQDQETRQSKLEEAKRAAQPGDLPLVLG